MNPKSKLSIFIAVTTALITFACLGGAPAISTPAASTEAPQAATQEVVAEEGKLEIVSTHSYIDSFNDFNVSGEIANNTNDNIENVTLSLSITDENGASLLKDDNDNPVDQIDIQPYISTLAPGALSPFNYYISVGDTKPAKYDVSIKSHDLSSAPRPIQYDIQKVQTTVVGEDVIITGEVVNMTSEQMNVESLAGAFLDDKNNVLAANSTLTYTRYLYPAGDAEGRDRGPFVIKIFGPVDNIAQWKVYARPTENSTLPAIDVDLQLTGSYFDSYGTYHLLGSLTNNGSKQISPSIISGLYNPDQTVLDAASLNIPLYVNAGETTLFDINTFQVIDAQSAETAAQTASTVKTDLFWTFTTDYKTVALEKHTLKINKDDSNWLATGTVTNTSDNELSNITAVIQCVNANDQLVAVNYTSIYPVDDAASIHPGVTSEFNIDLYPPAETEALNNCSISFQGLGME